jgi:hypothetical protein
MRLQLATTEGERVIASLDLTRLIDFLVRNAWLATGVLLVVVVAAFALLVVRGQRRRQLFIFSVSEVLEGRRFHRGAFGIVTHARGTLGGMPLLVTRRGVILEGGERTVLLSPEEALRLLATPELLAATIHGRAGAKEGALVRGPLSRSVCPYCKDSLETRDREAIIRCPSCDSLHHAACWQEHGGCSVHGCLRVPGEVPSRSRVARPD